MSSPEDWDESEFSEEEDSGCDIPHTSDEICPECCSFGGDYQPGTEDCDFCSFTKLCSEMKYGKKELVTGELTG